MEIISKLEETETVELRDVDLVFVLGGGMQWTLEEADTLLIPKPLASGDIFVTYASTGETGRVNSDLPGFFGPILLENSASLRGPSPARRSEAAMRY